MYTEMICIGRSANMSLSFHNIIYNGASLSQYMYRIIKLVLFQGETEYFYMMHTDIWYGQHMQRTVPFLRHITWLFVDFLQADEHVRRANHVNTIAWAGSPEVCHTGQSLAKMASIQQLRWKGGLAEHAPTWNAIKPFWYLIICSAFLGQCKELRQSKIETDHSSDTNQE